MSDHGEQVVGRDLVEDAQSRSGPGGAVRVVQVACGVGLPGRPVWPFSEHDYRSSLCGHHVGEPIDGAVVVGEEHKYRMVTAACRARVAGGLEVVCRVVGVVYDCELRQALVKRVGGGAEQPGQGPGGGDQGWRCLVVRGQEGCDEQAASYRHDRVLLNGEEIGRIQTRRGHSRIEVITIADNVYTMGYDIDWLVEQGDDAYGLNSTAA